MKSQVTQMLETVAEEFGTTQFTKKFALTYVEAPDVPSSNWSRFNRLIMFLQGTADARGYKQWDSVGRHVKKGSKAIHILAPRYIVEKDEKTNEPKKKMVGFIGIPVFRYEDTEGDPLPEYVPKNPPNPDLWKLVEKRGIKIEWCNSARGEGGYVNTDGTKMVLCSEDFEVLAHELMHLYDGDTIAQKGGQDPEQETVAELGACVLGQLYGHDIKGNTYAYIATYAESREPAEVGKACMNVVTRVGNILERILVDASKL